jgi:hypothetical protein
MEELETLMEVLMNMALNDKVEVRIIFLKLGCTKCMFLEMCSVDISVF